MSRRSACPVLGKTVEQSLAPVPNDNTPARVRILIREIWLPWLADLVNEYPQLEFVTYADNTEMAQKACDCRAVFGNVNPSVLKAARVFQAGNTIEWVQVDGGGVDGYLRIDDLVNSDIVLTSGKIIKGPQIADHVFALLLFLTRNLRFFVDNMKTGQWSRGETRSIVELQGKTMLIVGLGGIGTQVAERAFSFGMRVHATDPRDVPYMKCVEYTGKPDELDSLLPSADVIVVCAPLTANTQGLFNAQRFNSMKTGAFFINVSRGQIVDSDALVSALKSGKLGGAGLDVLAEEPLPKDHPRWSFPNVIITPHVAWASDNQEERMKQLFRENIRRFLAELPLKNLVDKNKGY